MLKKRFSIVLAAALLLGGDALLAQAFTSTISGRVTNENAGLPGVTVTAKSPQLIGSRVAPTGPNGEYVFANLPGGDYTLTFELSSFQTVTKTQRLGSSQSVTIDAVLSLSGVATSLTVVSTSETVSQTSQQATTYTADTLNKLPTTRTILSAVLLTPGINANGANGAITISGAQSFDNLFMVNGVVVNDNLRGTPFNLFIEDAIQETTTSTSSVSAEYGRFTGGVVNTVTKSGGNVFSGSFRANLTNPAWSAISPAREVAPQNVLPTYEATLGGPAWKDHIWFFGAYRGASTSLASQTSISSNGAPVINYTATGEEKRYEGKLTLSPLPNHTFTGSMTKIDQLQGNYAFPNTKYYDQASIHDRTLPQQLWSGNYNGVISSNFFVEAQYSSRKFQFQNDGSAFSDLIQGTVLHDQTGGGYYNSPIFCAVCPGAGESRSNEDYVVKGTYFLSTPSLGSHNVVLGYDHFTGSRLSNNYQSGSSYFINGTNAIFRNGDIFPVVDSNTYLGFYPIPNQAMPSKILTHSAFLNDTWRLNNNLSLNLGVRYDKNHAADSKGAVTANDSAFSPRLSASFDPTGTGALRFSASYARYVGQVNELQVGSASSFGAPAAYYYAYTGPTLNGDPNAATLLTRAQVIQSVFDFYGITAPNQFPSKNANTLFGAAVPGVNTSFLGQSLKSPHNDEFSAGVGGQIGSKGSFRVDGIYRKGYDFYNNYVNLGTGQVTDALNNVYDLQVINNLNDPLSRKYYGLNTQFSYRPMQNLTIGGNWTWSHTYGNFVGENTGSGPIQSIVQQYPEYKQQAWNFPTGDLSQDQRHRVRLFGTYDMPLPKAIGLFSLSAVEAYDSGLPYGAVGKVRSQNYVTNPGYATPPSGTASPAYFFTSRDAFTTPSNKRTDLALNWSYKVGGLVEIFIQPQIINVFNYQQIATNGTLINTTIQDATTNSRLADFNPFTSTPVAFDRSTNNGNCPNAASGNVAANYCIPAAFGSATGVTAYQQPRTYRVSAGIRF